MPRTPFTIHIPDATLDDLHDRLARTRWPDGVAGAGWEYGTDLDYLKELVAYWRDGFDWRAQEAALNRFAQERVDVDGRGVHLIHQPGVGPAPMPLVLLHGWPDSIARFQRLIPFLTDPGAHGGDPADAVTVIAPSIPGYGFSDIPTTQGFGAASIAELLARVVVDELGYDRFAVHGGDIGSSIAESIARVRPGAVSALHLTNVPGLHNADSPDNPSEAEAAFFRQGEAWGQAEGGYAKVQSTKPQSLAYGLNDSPAGLAAWIVEKFRAWSDCGGDIERSFTKDELLTNITIYWVTGTIRSSFQIYYEGFHRTDHPPGPERLDVPTGFALFPKEIVLPPREWAERFFDVRKFTEMPRGGHFAALEEPELLADDITAFLRTVRA